MTTQFVSSGVVSSGVIVSSGNILEVLSGGTADVTSVTSGGTQQVDSGGFASGTVISAGGSDTVFGSDTGATVNGGGSEIVHAQGTVSSATVNSGGLLIMEGGHLSGASINSGGTLFLSGGFGPEFFTNVVNNGTIDFDNANGNMSVASGTGVIEVTNGASLHLSLTSSSNFTGTFVISGGGVFGEGLLDLTSAGAALGRPIDLAAIGADLHIDDTVMPSDVISGFVPGARFIGLTGTPFNSSGTAQVLSGNVLQVIEGSATDKLQLDPSVDYSSLFSAGDSLVLLPRGGGTLVTIGQVVTVTSGGGISGTTISSGIIEEIFGSAVSTTVAAGGIAVVFSGGTASATALNGADEFLYGTDTSATLVSGATLRVETGATASGDTLGNGGFEVVFSGGVTSGATVNEGGSLNVRGGTAYTTFVSGTTTSIGGALSVPVRRCGEWRDDRRIRF
jgi:autotransporter passenger strand-loop-strand repeat protein